MATSDRRALERVPESCRLAFVLDMEPRSVQTRVRIGVSPTGKRVMYNDASKQAYFNEIVLRARRYAPKEPFTGPLRVDLLFAFPRTLPLLRKFVPNGLLPHAVRPDSDNCRKGATDALTLCGFWKNDSQIFTGMTTKVYVERGVKPRIEVEIWEAP